MLYVLTYAMAADAEPAQLGELFPRHLETWTSFQRDGTLVAIGPMENTSDGALAVFRTREAAEEFARADPFVREGMVGEWKVTGWREALLGA